MCGICGCSEEGPVTLEQDTTETLHSHDHHDIIHIEQDLLAKNNRFAAANRRYFLNNNIVAINLMSSPGSGKTTLLARTITELKPQLAMAVIVGDQQTDYDAQRLQAAGVEALQVNTGRVCHLDAHMIGHSLEKMTLKEQTLLFIENVGNLVCPAIFDLGEAYKVVLLSVTEGENKPLKYPEMFHRADVLIITKIDLLPYVEFDLDKCIEYAKRINPSITIIMLSSTTGEGLHAWYEWLQTAKTKAYAPSLKTAGI